MAGIKGPVRDEARRNTRARFEQWAKNPTCKANTVSAVHNVRLAKVASSIKLRTTFGQSPFALAHGQQFERNLFYKEGKSLLEALIEKEVLPPAGTGLLDLRLKMNGGKKVLSLDESLKETKRFLRSVAAANAPAKRKSLPALIAGATVRIPRGVMLPEAVLIIDALVLRVDGELPELIVGEIKTYPDRGGHTGTQELAQARAQGGIYHHALELVLGQEKLTDAIALSPTGFLVLTRPGSNMPSIRAGEDLRYQAARAKRGFELLEQAAHDIPSFDSGATEEDLIAAVLDAPTSYSETCLMFCDLSARCFDRALQAGDPIVLGEDTRRFLGETTLPRALELLSGAEPMTDAERDLTRRIAEIEGLRSP